MDMEQETPTLDEKRQERPYLRCRLGSLWLALPVEMVQEVCELVEATPVPLAAPHIVGVFNLRGRVVPLIDLARFLRQDDAPADAEPAGVGDSFRRIVVLNAAGMSVGIACDRVREVVVSDAPRPATTCSSPQLRRYALGELDFGADLALVLDVPLLLQQAKVSQ